jgi:hypothetical protein
MDVNREKAIDLAVSQIEKQFGKGAIMKLGEGGIVKDVQTISTGSLGLDIALGIGGVPCGRVSRSTALSPPAKRPWRYKSLPKPKRAAAWAHISTPNMRWIWAMPRNSALRPMTCWFRSRPRRAGIGDRRDFGAQRRH